MFLEWKNDSGKLQMISGKFQDNAINDVEQISLSHVIILRILLDNILMKFEKCRQHVLLYVGRFLILVPEFLNVTRLFLNVFIKSNSSMRKNPEKPNKYVSKNRRSGKLAFFPPNLLTKDFIISDVIVFS